MSRKTLLLVYFGKRGGGAKYSFEAAKALVENGYDVYVIISEYIENIQDWEKINFKELHKIKTYRNTFEFILYTLKFIVFDVFVIKRKFKNKGISILYTPMIQPWSLMLNFVFRDFIKVTTLHDPIPHLGSNKLFDFLVNLTVKFSDKIIVLSETFVSITSQKYNKAKENIYVIKHGIFSYKPENQTNNNNYSNEINFLFFGRITDYKGINILIKAYKKLIESNKLVTLRIVGEGRIDNYIDKLEIKKLNINVHNKWVQESQISNYFNVNNTVCVLPYIQASQSGVIPIAMSSKVLIISTNVGGLKEQVNSSNAIIIKENDVESLYEAMLNVVINNNSFKHLIERGLSDIEKLNWKTLFKDFNLILEDVK